MKALDAKGIQHPTWRQVLVFRDYTGFRVERPTQKEQKTTAMNLAWSYKRSGFTDEQNKYLLNNARARIAVAHPLAR